MSKSNSSIFEEDEPRCSVSSAGYTSLLGIHWIMAVLAKGDHHLSSVHWPSSERGLFFEVQQLSLGLDLQKNNAN